MPTLQDKLAESLAVLKKLQDEGIIAIQTKSVTRTHRERLVKNGFIKEVMKRKRLRDALNFLTWQFVYQRPQPKHSTDKPLMVPLALIISSLREYAEIILQP